MDVSLSITLVIALLAFFFILVTVFKYTIVNTFVRTRLTMSALFLFIVATLSISFWPYAALTLPYSVPALGLGMLLGHVIGVRAAKERLMLEGLEHYMEHFAHITPSDKTFSWWSFVNFYSLMCGLVLINLVGFTNVILKGSPSFIIATSSVGALLIGSIVPYLAHLWSIKAPGAVQESASTTHESRSATSE